MRILILIIISFSIVACSEKTEKTEKKINKEYLLEKANVNFQELERESEKSPEELTLPETKDEATMLKVNKKLVKRKMIITKRDIHTKYPLKNGYPIWFYNPNYGGYIGAVGIARKTKNIGYPEQKRLAIMIAQANLSKQLKLLVNAEVYTEKLRISRKDYEEYKSKLKSLSRQESSAYLRNTVVKDEWIDPKTGDLYVWVVLEK